MVTSTALQSGARGAVSAVCLVADAQNGRRSPLCLGDIYLACEHKHLRPDACSCPTHGCPTTWALTCYSCAASCCGAGPPSRRWLRAPPARCPPLRQRRLPHLQFPRTRARSLRWPPAQRLQRQREYVSEAVHTRCLSGAGDQVMQTDQSKSMAAAEGVRQR